MINQEEKVERKVHCPLRRKGDSLEHSFCKVVAWIASKSMDSLNTVGGKKLRVSEAEANFPYRTKTMGDLGASSCESFAHRACDSQEDWGMVKRIYLTGRSLIWCMEEQNEKNFLLSRHTGQLSEQRLSCPFRGMSERATRKLRPLEMLQTLSPDCYRQSERQ